jgi:hypothetical protein
MVEGQRFSYARKQNDLGLTLHVPSLNIVLTHRDRTLQVKAFK